MAEKFLTQEQLSVFCSSLAMLLRSGASLSEASSLFEEDGMDTALRQASTEISLSVAAGETFSAAAEKTGVFPEYALSVFSTAELSGRLDEALDRLADHYDRQSALYDRLRSTLTYPESLEYLEKHYGLTVNKKEYIVTYEIFADNQLPTVQVLVRGEE